MKEYVEFGSAVGRGLAEAIKSDEDVFVLATSGVLMSTKRLRGVGMALALYVVIRRVDKIAGHYAQIMGRHLSQREASDERL